MEPMNCTAHFHDGLCEVWAPTQNLQEVQQAVAMSVDLPLEQVTVHVPLIGGGFGRRLQTDYAVEAAQVSRAVNAPVQVMWTRDDDLQHDFVGRDSMHRIIGIRVVVMKGHIFVLSWSLKPHS